MALRTDMAAELMSGFSKKDIDTLISRSDITIDKISSRRINKPEGKYCTIESRIIADGLISRYGQLTDALADALGEFICGARSVLTVGLGNPNLTADALGSKVFKNLMITRHICNSSDSGVSTSGFCPNVMGVTGIESFDIIKGVVDRTRPELVIVVDSLASAAVGRLASAFQICSSGITPGSGVANHRKRLDKSTLGTKVISVGVPMVVYASTIISDALGETENKGKILDSMDNDISSLIVTPKDIDILVEECAKIIANALNKATGVPNLQNF